MADGLDVKMQRSPALSDDGRRRLAQVYTLLLEIANRSETASQNDVDDQAQMTASDTGLPGHSPAETATSPGRKGQTRRQRKSTQAQEPQSLNRARGQHALPGEGAR